MERLKIRGFRVFHGLLAVFLGFNSSPIFAALVGIVDSGVDFTHPHLIRHQWENPDDKMDGVDNDRNGYVDDLSGWNFANNNSKIHDPELEGLFPHDVYYFFEVQTRLLKGEATQADKKWIEEKKNDQLFLMQLQKFGNWIHGSHVAGISSKRVENAKLIALRIIGTQASWLLEYVNQGLRVKDTPISDPLIKMALSALANQQGKMLAAPGQYLLDKNVNVANCSFGSSATQVKVTLAPIIKIFLGREPTEEEIETYTNYFLTQALESVKKSFVDPAKNTLFVFAAGNDGSDNDKMPMVPANIATEHSLSVAATLGRSKLAVFSNYGVTRVDVAAPGVGIMSSIPGSAELLLSGTSQAAPYVANTASQILEINPKLLPSEVKEIIFQTVDIKTFLKGKVKSSGIVNPKRSAFAAQLSLNSSLIEAIVRSRYEVEDVEEVSILPEPQEIFVVPMLPMLK